MSEIKINSIAGIALLVIAIPTLLAIGCEGCARLEYWRIKQEQAAQAAEQAAARARAIQANHEYCIPLAQKFFREHSRINRVNCRSEAYRR